MAPVMRDVITSMEEFIYGRLVEEWEGPGDPPFQGRIFPGMSPSGEVYPLLTYDLGYSEVAKAGVGVAAARFFSQRWEFSAWTEGITRLPSRLELQKVFMALLEEDGEPKSWKFVSDIDGGEWDVTVMYLGPMPAPSRIVDDEGTYGRVTHGFQLDINLVK